MFPDVHALTLAIYKHTLEFPRDELLEFAQMRRAADYEIAFVAAMNIARGSKPIDV